MTVVQIVAMAAVAMVGGMVALVSDPLRQMFVLSIYGVSLTMLFFSLQAPDVALSELVVSTIALPVIILAALRKIRQQERSREEDDSR